MPRTAGLAGARRRGGRPCRPSAPGRARSSRPSYLRGQAISHGHHRKVSAEEAFGHVVAEDDPTHAGLQPVGADDEVEPPWSTVLERDLTVIGDGGDLVAEHILCVTPAGVVVDLAEIVAHDLDVPI